MDVRCPRPWAGETPGAIPSDLVVISSRPARVLAASDAVQGATGLADRGTFTLDERLRRADILNDR